MKYLLFTVDTEILSRSITSFSVDKNGNTDFTVDNPLNSCRCDRIMMSNYKVRDHVLIAIFGVFGLVRVTNV